jgi:transglutaminase superfamily protein
VSARHSAAVAAVLVLLAWPRAGEAQGTALAGVDEVRLELPAGALVESYANSGYRLDVAGGIATVRVDLSPLRSRQPFALPTQVPRGDSVAALARGVAAGAETRYQAVTQVLDWVARNVSYQLDRDLPQEPAEVLERRSGYCTGIARLSVALLDSLGIPARAVPGFVVADGSGVPAGFHRWVEVHYDDVGWVFSDPILSLHYVPAIYVRLASESLLPAAEMAPGKLLGRDDRRLAVDVAPGIPQRLTVRRNDATRRAGALRVTVDGASDGTAVLEGHGLRRTRALAGGESTFLGLEPGSYLLRVEVPGASPSSKRVILRERVWGTVDLPAPPTARAGEPDVPASIITKEEST